jgi:AdoMet-dependent heme synthase
MRSASSSQMRINFNERPMLVFWETTQACQLACRHCRASATVDPAPGELTPVEGRDLVAQVAGFGRPAPVLIFTGGDCLLRRDLFDLIGYAQSLGVPVAVAPSVTSALDDQMVARIAGSGVRAVSVSLDGANAATHDAIRGIPGHFTETIDAIERLAAAGVTVQVNTTVMRANADQLADTAALISRAGASIWEVFFLVHVGRGAATEAVDPEEHEQICHFLFDMAQYDLTVRTVEAPFFRRVAVQRCSGGAPAVGELYHLLSQRRIALFGPAPKAERPPTAATRDGKGIIFIANDGKVYPAGFLPVAVGDIRSRSLMEIYRGDPTLRDIRAGRFTGRCGRCEFADLCGGSRARAFAATGDPLATDPACPHQP